MTNCANCDQELNTDNLCSCEVGKCVCSQEGCQCECEGKACEKDCMHCKNCHDKMVKEED